MPDSSALAGAGAAGWARAARCAAGTAGLGPEPHQHAHPGGGEHRPVVRRGDGRAHVVKVQRAGGGVEQQQPHQQRQPADDGDGEIGVGGGQRLPRFVLRHPHAGTEREHLKKHIGGQQIARQEHAHQRSLGQQQEEDVARRPLLPGEVVPVGQRRHEKGEGGQRAEDQGQPVPLERQAHGEHPGQGDVDVRRAPAQGGQGGFNQRAGDQRAALPLRVAADQRVEHRRGGQGKEHGQQNHSLMEHPLTSSIPLAHQGQRLVERRETHDEQDRNNGQQHQRPGHAPAGVAHSRQTGWAPHPPGGRRRRAPPARGRAR